MDLLFIQYPSWLKPEIIPGLPVRWYGLMYVFAFATAFFVYRMQVKERKYPMTDDQLSSLFIWGISGLLLGARLFSTIIYYPDNTYLLKPWLIFWPFQNGKFTGLQGMSYHGGAFGGLLGVILWAKFKRFNFRETADMFSVAIPAGFTFGRIGNFINAELYGRATASPLGMLFPDASLLPAGESWVREIAEKTNIAITGAYVNLPRYPSQLYEAVFEGLILWGILWLLRKKKPFKGVLLGLYFFGYGFFRFFIEYFREPDSHIGYPVELVKNTLHTAYSHPPLSFSTGQILCFLMMLFGVIWIIIMSRMPEKEVIYYYDEIKEDQTGDDEAAQRNKRRKLRRKLR